jgi:hypothetical protein
MSPRDPQTPLNVLCETRLLDGILESYFIKEILLGSLDRPLRIVPVSDAQAVSPSDNLLVINLFDRSVPLIQKIIDAGCKNVGVFHMGDEHARCDRSYYKDVDYILRNYYFPETLQLPANCRCLAALWVPNGYRIGVGPRSRRTILPTSERKQMLFFAGFIGDGDGIPERVEMLEYLKQCDVPATVIRTPGFARGLGPANYAAQMETARFALVPRGQAPETIRLFDALELGCIPITIAHPFLAADDAMAGSPVVQLKSWQDLPRWLAGTMSSPSYEADVAELQERCLTWWSAFKQSQQERIAQVIERSFARI